MQLQKAIFDVGETSEMRKSWYLLPLALAVGTQGCRRSNSEAASVAVESAQQEFLQTFLAAHARKDLDAEKALVDWDDITEESKQYWLKGLQYNLDTKITSARIEDIPGLTPRFAATYNIPPDKFLVVDYADRRGEILVKYPIGSKEGRYYFAMFGLTREAMRRNNERLKKEE